MNYWMRKRTPKPTARYQTDSLFSTSFCFTFIRNLTFFLITISPLSNSTYAQYQGYTAVTDMVNFKTQFTRGSANIMTIACDFSQQKTLTALTEKITSKGRFWFKRSNKVRMEYTKPFVYLIVINGDKMLLRDQQKENRINVKTNKLFKQMNHIIIDCIQGNIMEIRDFNTHVFENGSTFKLELTPVSKTLLQVFQTIVLTIDKKDYSARSIEINEPMGDTTLISFENKKLNEAIPDAVFAP